MFLGSVDVLDAVNIDSDPLGVTRTVGMCHNRATTVSAGEEPAYGEPDLAYTLSAGVQLTVPTSNIFPSKSNARETTIRY